MRGQGLRGRGIERLDLRTQALETRIVASGPRCFGGADEGGDRILRVAGVGEDLAQLLESGPVTGILAEDGPQALDGALLLAVAEIDTGLCEELFWVSFCCIDLAFGAGLRVERRKRRQRRPGRFFRVLLGCRNSLVRSTDRRPQAQVLIGGGGRIRELARSPGEPTITTDRRGLGESVITFEDGTAALPGPERLRRHEALHDLPELIFVAAILVHLSESAIDPGEIFLLARMLVDSHQKLVALGLPRKSVDHRFGGRLGLTPLLLID